MADDTHKPGTMDIEDHEKTFQAFIRFTTNAVIGIFIFLILLALINA